MEAGRSKAPKLCVTTFDPLSVDNIEALVGDCKNDKYSAQWASTLAAYASPFIGIRVGNGITAADVYERLEPIWTQKPETARREPSTCVPAVIPPPARSGCATRQRAGRSQPTKPPWARSGTVIAPVARTVRSVRAKASGRA